MSPAATARRGEIWLVDLGMVAKVRPCLILSIPIAPEDRALVTLVPHTTSLRGSRFEVTLSVPFLKTGGFDAQGLSTTPIPHLIRSLGRLSPNQLSEVEAAVCLWLGLKASVANQP